MLNLIMEGGALRMDHPYDLPNINTGVDSLLQDRREFHDFYLILEPFVSF